MVVNSMVLSKGVVRFGLYRRRFFGCSFKGECIGDIGSKDIEFRTRVWINGGIV